VPGGAHRARPIAWRGTQSTHARHLPAPPPAPLSQKAYQRVRADFQNVDVAFQRARLRAAFLQLPRGAVEHLLRAQELCTVSENTVFLAAASWLRAREREAAVAAEEGGAGAEGGDALELLRLVRGATST
jgi:hypothetical protein